ncbi:hypothetical protein M1O14_02015 [Dehalococcoidia bacterium]|nr:hypothetical protein [Dehalococcoidia bacterium]
MRNARRIAALAGVIGGLWWLASLLRCPAWLHPGHAEILTLGVVLSLLGIGGGILGLVKHRVGRVLMLASGTGGVSVPFVLFWRGMEWTIRPFPVFAILVVGASGALLLVTWKKPSRARMAALVLGIIAGLMSATAAQITIGRIGEEFAGLSPFFTLIGIVGGILALGRPRTACVLMVIAGIGCFLAAGISSLLLLAYPEFDFDLIYLLFMVPAWVDSILMLKLPVLAYSLSGILFIAGGMLSLASARVRPAATYVALLLASFGALLAILCAPLVHMPLMWATPFVMLKRAGLIPEWIILYWVWVLLFPIMGSVAVVLVLGRQKLAGILMLTSAISGFTGLLIFLIPFDELPLVSLPGSLLLALGGAFALLSARKQPKERASP